MSHPINPIGLYAHTSTHRAALGRWSGSNQDKYEAASTAWAELRQQGIDSCLFGSLGCKLYGVNCKPNDVDMILLVNVDIEEMKRSLVRNDPHSRFYLLPSQDPNATYRVLWYATNRGARVKVDILQPGTLSVPTFQFGDLVWIYQSGYNLPVAPFGALLLLKLQGWDDHRQSNEARFFEKHYADVSQILGLLEIGVEKEGGFNPCYLPAEFMKKSQERIYAFVQLHPNSEYFWSSLGFRVRRPRRRRR